MTKAQRKHGTAAGAIYDKCTLYVPEESVEAYQKAAVWKEFSSILPIKSSGISETATDAEPVVTDIFNIHGIRIDSPLPGQINILKMSDGSVRKILLK